MNNKEEFMKSEAAGILSDYPDVHHPDIPGWITEGERQQYLALSDKEREQIKLERFLIYHPNLARDAIFLDPAELEADPKEEKYDHR
jgi:hypothetical protein